MAPTVPAAWLGGEAALERALQLAAARAQQLDQAVYVQLTE